MVQREAILKGNITGVFFRYVTPGVIGMVGMSLYILADTYFIANGVGRLGLAALNIGLPAYNLIFGIGALLGIGGGTVFSILHGRGELGRANRPFTISAVLGTAFSLLFALLGLVAAEPIAFLLGATEETALYTTTYLRVILLFSPAFILNNIMTAFVRNDGNPHLAMAAMTISTLTNIVLDYVCIYPLKLGMFGAALATGLGSVLGLLIQLTHFLRRGNSLRLQRIRPTVRETLQIMRCGISNFITEFSAGIVILAFNAVILRLAGNTGVAAYGIAANIAIVCTAFFNGIGQGVQPIISTNYGALQMGRVWRAFLLAAALCRRDRPALLWRWHALSHPDRRVIQSGKIAGAYRARCAGVPSIFSRLRPDGLQYHHDHHPLRHGAAQGGICALHPTGRRRHSSGAVPAFLFLRPGRRLADNPGHRAADRPAGGSSSCCARAGS